MWIRNCVRTMLLCRHWIVFFRSRSGFVCHISMTTLELERECVWLFSDMIYLTLTYLEIYENWRRNKSLVKLPWKYKLAPLWKMHTETINFMGKIKWTNERRFACTWPYKSISERVAAAAVVTVGSRAANTDRLPWGICRRLNSRAQSMCIHYIQCISITHMCTIVKCTD